MRPQQVYEGEWLRAYMPVSARKPADKVKDAAVKDAMHHVQTSNATRRRLAGESTVPHHDLSPAWTGGVSVGDATSGMEHMIAADRS